MRTKEKMSVVGFSLRARSQYSVIWKNVAHGAAFNLMLSSSMFGALVLFPDNLEPPILDYPSPSCLILNPNQPT